MSNIGHKSAADTDTILVTSGYRPEALKQLRRDWRVVDLSSHADALAHLRRCERLPLAVAVGHAVLPDDHAEDPDAPLRAASGGELPAHVMLAQILAIDADLPVVISTGLADPRAIVYLIQRGAFDYVVEPSRQAQPAERQRYAQDLHLALHRGVKWRKTLLENRRLKAERSAGATDVPAIRAASASMGRVTALIRKVAPTPATVLIVGESGTGKEVAARSIHDLSDRRDQPFVGINCGALDDALLNSELFGHERGAFTGAEFKRKGLIREAGQGTLFLDEVASISAAFQVSLLRVLEERSARPVGGEQSYPVHCRILAASNQPVRDLVERGDFREDLYYRLNVFQIALPPLRNRAEDIPVLAQHFLDGIGQSYGRATSKFTPAAMEALERHSWPGNVRELRNCIERAVILSEGQLIHHSDIAASLGSAATPIVPRGPRDLKSEVERFEAGLIRDALARTRGNLTEAARMLRIKRTTLHYRLRQLGIR